MSTGNFLIVDDEFNSAMDLQEVLSFVEPDCNAEIRTEAEDALQYLGERKGQLEAVFLDMQLRGILGIELYEQLKQIDPAVPIVFVTAYDQYALQSWKVHAAGYIMKPVDPAELKDVLSYIRQSRELAAPVTEEAKEQKLQIRCFGNFEVFADGKPLAFKRKRSKEVLAYLIDRKGQFSSGDEICEALWEDNMEDRKNKNYLRQLIYDIQHALQECGSQEVLVHRRNQYAVDVGKLDCDYYRYLDREEGARELFAGEYMSQYSWAEERLGYLLFYNQ